MSTTPTPATGDHRLPRRGWFTVAVWRNPLARGTDRTEATVTLLVICLWLLTLPIIATAGSLSWDGVSALAADEQLTRTQTTATLTADATNLLFSEHGIPMSGTLSVPARWVAPDGSDRTGAIDTGPGDAKIGDVKQIWVDGAGNVTPPPMTGTGAAVLLILVTAAAWLMLGALLGAGWLVVKCRLNRSRLTAWDRDWQQVEPLWSGRRR